MAVDEKRFEKGVEALYIKIRRQYPSAPLDECMAHARKQMTILRTLEEGNPIDESDEVAVALRTEYMRQRKLVAPAVAVLAKIQKAKEKIGGGRK